MRAVEQARLQHLFTIHLRPTGQEPRIGLVTHIINRKVVSVDDGNPSEQLADDTIRTPEIEAVGMTEKISAP